MLFFTLKTNKSPSYDNLNVNECNQNQVSWVKIPLMNIFSQSLSTGTFPNKMKIAGVLSIFKNVKKNYCIHL